MRKIKFWSLISCYFVLVLADGALTYINTSDLSFEGNPLVSQLGFGWAALAIANIVVFILIFLTSYYSYFKYKTKYNDEIKFTAYCSQIFYDRPDRFWVGLIPKHISPFIAMMGFAILYAGMIARLILVLEWLCITFNVSLINPYFHFRDTHCFGRVDIFAATITGIICAFYWLYKEFKKQLKEKTQQTAAR